METLFTWQLVEGALLSLLFFGALFIPMEKVFPAKKKQGIFREQWKLDLLYFLGQYLFWAILVIWTLSYFSDAL